MRMLKETCRKKIMSPTTSSFANLLPIARLLHSIPPLLHKLTLEPYTHTPYRTIYLYIYNHHNSRGYDTNYVTVIRIRREKFNRIIAGDAFRSVFIRQLTRKRSRVSKGNRNSELQRLRRRASLFAMAFIVINEGEKERRRRRRENGGERIEKGSGKKRKKGERKKGRRPRGLAWPKAFKTRA